MIKQDISHASADNYADNGIGEEQIVDLCLRPCRQAFNAVLRPLIAEEKANHVHQSVPRGADSAEFGDVNLEKIGGYFGESNHKVGYGLVDGCLFIWGLIIRDFFHPA